MSAEGFSADVSPARAGRLGCACPPDSARLLRRVPGQGRLAAGFALVVLAQALTVGVLPLAGAMLAPDPRLAALPLAVLMLGAAVASVPAAFLLDSFGRRAGFALGASLGMAGGLIGAHGLYLASFRELLIGCAWLGAAQGFGMFYRHAAAFGTGTGMRAGAVGKLLGAGVLAGLAGPVLAGWAEGLSSPFTFVGTLILAALAQLGVLIFAVALPEARFSHADARPADALVTAAPRRVLGWRALVGPTLIAAAAWAVMGAAMSGVPVGLVVCGVAAPTVTGIVAWHVVAMYAPALAGGRLAERFGAGRLALSGLALALAGVAVVRLATEPGPLAVAFITVGVGWSLATLGATLVLHARGAASRLQLALHDGTILLCALAGVLLAAI
ncbi:MFS transporter [Ancylobacter sonchi]|uniref:MFS transporter n=1 Tax=Ancylobacter sonchi TaxID=1937790 RepID=UPI001BD24A1C|nr:MFS transporter [Ancylobacter sonchi]MBS7536862.1 MFS transporter [Ancylobacter sonchi]